MKVAVSRAELPDTQCGFDLDPEVHLGLTELTFSEVNGDFLDLKSKPGGKVCHFHLENITVGFHPFQWNRFQHTAPPQAKTTGHIPLRQAQNSAGVKIAPP